MRGHRAEITTRLGAARSAASEGGFKLSHMLTQDKTTDNAIKNEIARNLKIKKSNTTNYSVVANIYFPEIQKS